MQFKGVDIPKESEVKVPTDVCLIARGLDAEGEPIYSVLWASESEDNLPEFMVGLGMAEAAKLDFIDRCSSDD